MKIRFSALFLFSLFFSNAVVFGQPSEQQLTNWLKRFPAADANGDGQLTVQEAEAFRQKQISDRKPVGRKKGAPREFEVDPGWQADRFPDQAVCYRSPKEIAELYGKITSRPKPADGSLRIVGTGHSFMAPGYRTFPNPYFPFNSRDFGTRFAPNP